MCSGYEEIKKQFECSICKNTKYEPVDFSRLTAKPDEFIEIIIRLLFVAHSHTDYVYLNDYGIICILCGAVVRLTDCITYRHYRETIFGHISNHHWGIKSYSSGINIYAKIKVPGYSMNYQKLILDTPDNESVFHLCFLTLNDSRVLKQIEDMVHNDVIIEISRGLIRSFRSINDRPTLSGISQTLFDSLIKCIFCGMFYDSPPTADIVVSHLKRC